MLGVTAASIFLTPETGGLSDAAGATADAALTAELEDALATEVEDTASETVVEDESSYNWGNLKTLEDHFQRHGADFQATSSGDYAGQAQNFYDNRVIYQSKIDENGITRVYDPETNSFGSYNLDGSTKTFFKPNNGLDYFTKQPGK
jgi:pyocin large subunit-like protein